MREVAVIGVGMTKIGKFPDRLLSSIGREAVLLAMKDAKVERSDIQAAYSGNLHGGSLLGQRILKDLGMTGMPILNFENVCSSGSTALREGSGRALRPGAQANGLGGAYRIPARLACDRSVRRYQRPPARDEDGHHPGRT